MIKLIFILPRILQKSKMVFFNSQKKLFESLSKEIKLQKYEDSIFMSV